MTPAEIEQVWDAYIECALWSDEDMINEWRCHLCGAWRPRAYPECSETHPLVVLDDNEEREGEVDEDILRAEGFEDVFSFCADQEIAPALAVWAHALGLGQIGHDFWLTRNGHGAGFWDRSSNPDSAIYAAGRRLTEASKPYGEVHLVVGDDGKVHIE